MRFSPFSRVRRHHAHRGVALVIVLAFVLLLTGLVLAFFSRAISERQISNSSVNLVKVDVLARGAVDTVVSDLQQEIAAGSTPYPLPSPMPAQGSATLFVPSNAATMVPAQVLPSPTPASGTSGLENLVKQSAGGQPFYPTTNYSANYPPTRRAAVSASGTGANGDNSTAKPSLGGRYISPARWNKSLLLPATSTTDYTPVITGGTFVPPDWVVVARDGSNPKTWDNNLRTSNASTTSAVGRFAYNIYDEGGLLDADVVGYPAGAYPSDAAHPAPLPLPTHPTRKTSLAYADLTVPVTLASGVTQPMLTTREINALAGWRNYASAQPSGTFPNYTPAPTPGPLSAFDLSGLQSTSGDLLARNVALYNKQSDRMFEGRQQLIEFLLQGVATSEAERGTLQNSLLYLSAFSRELNQPSFLKVQSVPEASTVPGYDATAPAVLRPENGGNNAGPSSSGLGLDSAINPSFLNVRVKTTSGRRFDGSNLIAGEPLVKKRFPLNRLAWLTYAGPITLDGINYNPGLNTSYVSTLKTTYGFTDPFLKQGTAANIQACFGLNWDSANKQWSYNVHNRNGSTGPICKLDYPADSSDVARRSREPDFFELLKATINVGSIAKTATPPPANLSDANSIVISKAHTDQYKNDYAVDDAIIQIGANIIDQFDLDSYPTHINFNDGSIASGRDFYGDEDLPYFSGIKHALVKVKLPLTNPDGSVKDTGVGVLLQCPELWNPHDRNPAQTAVIAAPTQFQIWAECQNQDAYQLVAINTGGNNQQTTNQPGQDASPGWKTIYQFAWAPPPRQLSKDNTLLTFDTTQTQFREPTILFQSSSVTSSADKSKLDNINLNPTFFAGNAFVSAAGSGITNVPPVLNAAYVGFYVSSLPLFWQFDGSTGTRRPTARINFLTTPGCQFHYYLQYKDASGGWVTYDQKNQTWGTTSAGYATSLENGALSSGGAMFTLETGNEWKGFLESATQYDTASEYIDPRTSRFMHLRTYNPDGTNNWLYPPFVGPTSGWLDVAHGITVSARDGTSSGVAVPSLDPSGATNFFPNRMGWYPGIWYGVHLPDKTSVGTAQYATMFRPWLISQNNPFAYRDAGPSGGTGSPVYAQSIGNAPPADSHAPQYYADPDGVVRRAMGGLVPVSGTSGPAASSSVGLPMTTASGPTGAIRDTNQSISRPIVLNRPFRSVSDLGYTFAGTPWKTLDFNVPESGDAALLDVFCINDTDDANGLIAGKVNLNSRQAPVLQAIMAGAYKDEFAPGTATVDGASTTSIAAKAAAALVARTRDLTTAGKGPLRNVGELVGKWVSKQTLPGGGISPKSYDGFSADLWNGTTGVLASGADSSITRYQAASLRALANSGQTRIWNLLIDVVAQTGRYPQSATAFDKFNVEGEQRYWVHVAIDRLTGNVIDKQIEVVKE